MSRRAIHACLLAFLVLLLGWQVDSGRSRDESAGAAIPKDERRLLGARSSESRDSTEDDRNDLLRAALRVGEPVGIALGDSAPQTFLFRPQRALSDDFQVTLGPDRRNRIPERPSVYEGISAEISPNQEPARASLVVMGDALGAVIRDPESGRITYIRTQPLTGMLEARVEDPEDLQSRCQVRSDGMFEMVSTGEEDPDSDPWAHAIAAQVAAVTGSDPATGRYDKVINPIPRAQNYELSLKEALLVLVLDKAATGEDSQENLTSKASLFLATVSNVAAVYEHQLGIRLLVQEFIMIPDVPEITDIPTAVDFRKAFESFKLWMNAERPMKKFQWTMAAKFGAGLGGSTFGAGGIRALGTIESVSVSRTDAIWDVLAHEMGHNLGSDHSAGGVMNSSSTNGLSRSFFHMINDVKAPPREETAAKAIQRHAWSKLFGEAEMRDPEEIPFALRDHRTSAMRALTRFDPLENDRTGVLNGRNNELTLEEVSSIVPYGAGTVETVDDEIFFLPASDFRGTAWFSYSVRGSVGNNDQGWLHKGDVAVVVGEDAVETSPKDIHLAPGASYSLVVESGTGTLTQPTQALVDRSRDDDSKILIIRASPLASGSDTFSVGDESFRLIYDVPSLQTRPDRYLLDEGVKTFRFNPLVNDIGAGERWLAPIQLSAESATNEPFNNFPTTLRIVAVDNRTPALGELSTEARPLWIHGRFTHSLHDTLTFRSRSSGNGTARLEYIVEDATGNRGREQIEIILNASRAIGLVGPATNVRYWAATDDRDRALWIQPEFDDSAWRVGQAPLGYELNRGYESLIRSPLGSEMSGQTSSLYMRSAFTVQNPLELTDLQLQIRADDGYVAYINGHEVARASAEGTSPLSWRAQATASRPDNEAIEWLTIDLGFALSWLQPGENVLAIHGLNRSEFDSDFLLAATLDGRVGSSQLELLSPKFSELSMPLSGDLRLHAIGRGNVQGTVANWFPIEVPEGASVTLPESGEDGARLARFSATGTYTLQAIASEGAEQHSAYVTVHVGDPVPGIPRATPVDAGPDVIFGKLAGQLEGSVSEEVEALQWRQIAGPAESYLDTPDRISTSIVFPQEGVYRFLLTATHEGLQTADEMEVQVMPPGEPEVEILLRTSSYAESGEISAVIVGGVGEMRTVRVHFGFEDGGMDPSGWEAVLDLGEQPSRWVTWRFPSLLADKDYHYRVQVDETTWLEETATVTGRPPTTVSEVLVDRQHPVTVHLPMDGSLDGRWQAIGFDDHSWDEGVNGIGFDRDLDFQEEIQLDIKEGLFLQGTSAYARFAFESLDPSSIDALHLKMRYDDAFVAYLNGVEVARSESAPPVGEALNWQSRAGALRHDADALEPELFDLRTFRHLVRGGENILAIHGLNFSEDNPDFLMAVELEATVHSTLYLDWTKEHVWLEPNDAHIQADPDGDGMSNLFEYASGRDPRVAQRIGSALRFLDPGTLTYERRQDFRSRGLEYVLQGSSDLKQWEDWEPEEERLTIRREESRDVVEIDVSGAFRYLRLNVRWQ